MRLSLPEAGVVASLTGVLYTPRQAARTFSLRVVPRGKKRVMQAVLVMFRSDGERRSFSIARDMTVIGRREDCDLRIPLGDVSRKHCRLVRDGDMLKVEDLGSSNGTYLNGRRVQE